MPRKKSPTYVFTSTDLVVDYLVRGSLMYRTPHNPTQDKASRRLMALAEGIDPDAVRRVLAERDACLSGLVACLTAMAPDAPRRSSRKASK